MDLWGAIGLQEPCIVAFTGAGGKTSALLSLAGDARSRAWPLLLSTTTKMFYSQVKDYNPIFTDNFDDGIIAVKNRLDKEQMAAWFSGREGDKVYGVPPEWLDRLVQQASPPYILIEADGAQGLWIKAPADYEPVVPTYTARTVGILNLQAIGQPLTSAIAHRLPLVAKVLQKQAGDTIEWCDLARLAVHKQGIFKFSKGSKVLLLAGASVKQVALGSQIANWLRTNPTGPAGISRCVVTEGYGKALHPLAVYEV